MTFGLDDYQSVTPASEPDIDAFIKELEGDGFQYAPTVPVSTLIPQPDPADSATVDAGAQTPSTDPAVPDPATPATPDSTTPSATPPAPTDDYVEVNGERVAMDDIRRLYEFDQFLRNNPDKARQVISTLTDAPPTLTVPPGAAAPAIPTPPATPVTFTPPTPPEALDLTDPSQATLWNELVETRRQTFEQNQAFEQQRSEWQSQQTNASVRQAEADMAAALTQFRTTHPNLNDEDIRTIRLAAVPLFPGVSATIPSPVDALTRSMEIAAWAEQSTRPKLLDTTLSTPSESQQSRTRKQRLGSLADSPGTAPRTETTPQLHSDRDMKDALAKAFADAMGVSSN